jgi:hypothetical protein
VEDRKSKFLMSESRFLKLRAHFLFNFFWVESGIKTVWVELDG